MSKTRKPFLTDTILRGYYGTPSQMLRDFLRLKEQGRYANADEDEVRRAEKLLRTFVAAERDARVADHLK